MKKNITEKTSEESFRCKKCDKLLAKSVHPEYFFEIKCLRCGEVNKLFQKMKEQVIITDKKGKILFANEIAEDFTGYSLKEIIGEKPSLWGKQMPSSFYKEMWKTLLEEKTSFSGRITNKHKSGKLYEVMLRISPVLNAKGEVELLVGMESIVKNYN